MVKVWAVVVLVSGFVAVCGAEEKQPELMYKPEIPLGVIGLRSVNDLLGFQAGIIKFYGGKEVTREELLNPTGIGNRMNPYNYFLSFLNQEKPLGVMGYFNPLDKMLYSSFVVFMPINDEKEVKKLLGNMLGDPDGSGPSIMKRVRKDEQYESYMVDMEDLKAVIIFHENYLYVTNDLGLINVDMPDPLKVTKGYFEKHTLVVELNSEGVPHNVRETFMTYFKAASSGLGYRGGNLLFEGDESKEKIQEEFNQLVTDWIDAVKSVRISAIADPKDLKSTVDYELKMYPGAKLTKGMTKKGKDDRFINCDDEEMMVNYHYSQVFGKDDRESYLKSLDLCERKYKEVVAESERTPAALNFFKDVRQTFQQLDELNMFLQFDVLDGDAPGFLFGIHFPMKEESQQGLKEILNQIQFPLIESKGMKIFVDDYKYQGITLHRLEKNGLSLGIYDETNDDANDIVDYHFGIGKDVLWITIGKGDEKQKINQLIDKFLATEEKAANQDVAKLNVNLLSCLKIINKEREREPDFDKENKIFKFFRADNDELKGKIQTDQERYKVHLECESAYLHYVLISVFSIFAQEGPDGMLQFIDEPQEGEIELIGK